MKRTTDSESSSGESDVDNTGSESGSESSSESEAETPPPSPPKKKSYSLLTQISKLRQERPAMAPSTPSFQRGPPSVENPLSNSRPESGDGSKHVDHSAESGDNENEDNNSFSKYTSDSNRVAFQDFHDLNKSSHTGKASPSVGKPKSNNKSVSKPAACKPVKRPQPRTESSASTKSSGGGKGASAAPRVKQESSSKESAKSKPSKQSTKSVSSNQGKKTPNHASSGKGSVKSQEKKQTPRARPSEKRKQPKSSLYVETSDDSDSEDERTQSRPQKAAVNTSTSSSRSSASSNLSSSSINTDTSETPAQPKVKPESGKRMPGVKKGDKCFTKTEPLSDLYDHHKPPIMDIGHMVPILSPIRSVCTDDRPPPMLDCPPEIKYNEEGKKTLMVRLKRELIDHLPKGGVFKYESNVPGTSTQRRKDSTDPPEKPSAIVKPVKRKQTDLEKEVCGTKRSRLENKSPRRMREEALRGVSNEPSEALEPFVSNDSALDRRSSTERRGSVSSMSSQPSSHSSRGRKSERDHHQSGRSKRDRSDGRDPGSQHIHNWTSPERRPDRSVEMPGVARGSEADAAGPGSHRSGLQLPHSHSLPPHSHHAAASHPHSHRVEGEEWRVFPPTESYPTFDEEVQARHRLELDERQYTADDYLAEGKKLKDLADNMVDKNAKALTYFEAVVSLTSCGNAFELDPHVSDEKAITMYSDTCEIIRFILKLKGIRNDPEGSRHDNKLAVLCYRSQAVLNMHMFKLTRRPAMKLSRVIQNHLKGTSSKPQLPVQQNTSSWSSSGRYSGNQPSMSPTPSPAGSVSSACSLGSQGSASSEPSGGGGAPAPSSGVSGSKLCNGMNPRDQTVAVPQHILNCMSTFMVYSNYSLYSIDYWEQAETLIQENLEFFLDLDQECGELTLHSSTQELVHYVRRGLSKLRQM
ncbi:uncharacterized protein [Diadema setosum]|uniref:uncharacterized protein n=1 Tax=Diadema setosum TaxID=31175 RepID=UPI003B3AC07D